MTDDDAPRGPWNEGPGWDYVEKPEPAVDGGDGLARVQVSQKDVEVLSAMASRTAFATGQTRSTAPTLALGRMQQ
jgi:Mn-containing catalase